MISTIAHLLTVEIPHCVMELGMFVGIKQRAECTAKSQWRPQFIHMFVRHDVHAGASPRVCRRKVIIVDTSHCPCQPATRWEREPSTQAVRMDDSVAREPGAGPSARPRHASGISP